MTADDVLMLRHILSHLPRLWERLEMIESHCPKMLRVIVPTASHSLHEESMAWSPMLQDAMRKPLLNQVMFIREELKKYSVDMPSDNAHSRHTLILGHGVNQDSQAYKDFKASLATAGDP
jgi:hypothetical protein